MSVFVAACASDGTVHWMRSCAGNGASTQVPASLIAVIWPIVAQSYSVGSRSQTTTFFASAVPVLPTSTR